MKPFKFKPNRVRRSYTGGSGIDILRGHEHGHDGKYPEEWIASSIKAFSYAGEPADAGYSLIDDSLNTKFVDLLESHGSELLGKAHLNAIGKDTGFLMKLLDSAIRLPVQAHPDKLQAAKLFNSDYGKNEAWLILGTRNTGLERPHLLIGFNEKLNKKIFIKESISGILDKSLEMMHRIECSPGDVFMIPGGLAHAVGPGMTIIEIMEPSDWIVISERYCGEVEIDDLRRFNGLDPEKAMEMYDFTPMSRSEIDLRYKLIPAPIDDSLYSIIDREQIKYFGMQEMILKDAYILQNKESCCRAGIVVSGEVIINDDLQLRSGDAFFLPACLTEYSFRGNAKIILALPPVV